MDNWIPIEEDEPSLYNMVLVTDDDFVDMGAMQRDGDFCLSGHFLEGEVTHWMPLPEAPNEASAE